jgi:hypothetical protein
MILTKRFFLIAAIAVATIAAIALAPSRHHLLTPVHATTAPTVVIVRCSTFNGLLWAVSIQQTGPGASYGMVVPYAPPEFAFPCDQFLQDYVNQSLTVVSYGEILGTGLTDGTRTQVSTWTFQGIAVAGVQPPPGLPPLPSY